MSGYFSPGRIEVFGKHTDYAGGRSLLCAVDRGITVMVSPADDAIHATSAAATDSVRLEPGVDPGLPKGHWGRYLSVGVDRLAKNFGPLRPARLEIDSDLPLASGMSSSSALVVASMMALAQFNEFDQTDAWQRNIHSKLDLATYFASTEMGGDFRELTGDRGVGTEGGSEDHTAMICGEPGKLGMFSFDPPTQHGFVDMPDGHCFVIGVSGVAAEKTGAALELYNRVSWGAREIVRRYNEANGTDFVKLASLVDQADKDQIAAVVADDDYLAGRFEQFVVESTELIPLAFEALGRGDLDAFSAATARSFAGAVKGLGNQVPETMALVDMALSIGAVASSAFGAGFGGSVWAMVPDQDAEGFAAEWLARYQQQFPEPGAGASVLITRPSAGAHPVEEKL